MTNTKSSPTPRSSKLTGSKPAKKGRTAPAREPKVSRSGKTPPAAAKPKRPPARGDEVMELLRRKGGCTMDGLVKRTGLLPHSLRAVISVETRKRGLKVELVGKAHYRIVD